MMVSPYATYMSTLSTDAMRPVSSAAPTGARNTASTSSTAQPARAKATASESPQLPPPARAPSTGATGRRIDLVA